MPDLSVEGCAKFWHEYNDPMIYRVVTFLEGVEKWTLDGNPELEPAINELGQALDEIGKLDLAKLGHEKAIIPLANHIRSGRALRLLQAFDSAHPGSASKLLVHAEENSSSTEDAEGLFLRRNIVFERLRLLGRVFSQARLKLVLKALEGEDED